MKPDNYSSELTNSVRVTKTLETLPRGWISLSEDELIEAYNYAPRVLSRKAIKVSKIDFRGGRYSNSEVLLGEERNGNYWVMVTEKGCYWLLPKANFRINSLVGLCCTKTANRVKMTVHGTTNLHQCRYE